VSPLSEDGRIEEIARMLGGLEITERTREYARELIERCEAFRTSREEAVWQS
jgi:DNA repair protein RecN (Recombination protein N)